MGSALAIGALVLLVVAFAWSMGAHYTGACMGMPFASGSIGLWPSLITMAIAAFLGAAFASHKVELTVGLGIIDASRATLQLAIAVIASAFVLTTAFTYLKVPTSTIQILVFCVIGAALSNGIHIHWWTVLHLAVIWVVAPVAAAILGYVFTHLLDLVATERGGAGLSSDQMAVLASGLRPLHGAASLLPRILVVVGAAASFTMGANDVSNATGVFLMTHLWNVWTAGVIGGLGLALGVVTWGKPLLHKVAFDLVQVDLAMASAAQLVQAVVVFVAVMFGYFTSMNQALVGAMAGTGIARGRGTVRWPAIRGIVLGWFISPPAALAISFVLGRLAS